MDCRQVYISSNPTYGYPKHFIVIYNGTNEGALVNLTIQPETYGALFELGTGIVKGGIFFTAADPLFAC